jgi:lambda repressor-like predicted transcriptional regulator
MVYRFNKIKLSNINNELRNVINGHLEKTGKSLNQFCKDAGVQQNQMWMFLNRIETQRGLHTKTVEKLGKYFETCKL